MPAEAFRGALFTFHDEPDGSAEAYTYLDDGLLVVEDGVIVETGEAAEMAARLPGGVPVTTFPGRLIMPGFIDTHIHFPQTDIIAAHGKQLLDWLKSYTFPAEMAFADRAHAETQAVFFVDELLRNGTTTALVFASVHPHSADALFAEARKREMRLITGKVLMDRHAPAALTDTADSGVEESAALIRRWHGIGRLQYALTPRFAPTSSDRQLQLTGRLLGENPGVYLHTHLSENPEEIAWVQGLFPQSAHYLDVYDRYHLVTDRSVFAHGIHLDAAELHRLAEAGSALAFCPSSNLFLGSGLFDHAAARAHGIPVGLGTDVGAGTSFSLISTMSDAYKVCQLKGVPFDPLMGFYLATLGGARALKLEKHIGSLAPGREADFVVLDLAATPLLARRAGAGSGTIAERLFALSLLGDDRAVARTYVNGRLAHDRDAP